MQARIKAFLDAASETFSYVVFDQAGGHAAVIDPVLDYDPASGRTTSTGAEKIVAFVQAERLQLDWILETHAHADHLSAAPFIQQQLGGRIAIGARIAEVQQIFRDVFNLEKQFPCDGSQFDKLFADGETFTIGKLPARVIATPGHTPADVAWHIGDAVFVGDTLFPCDVGTARCDFPGGSAASLYHSIHKLLALPDDTSLYMCHDYPPAGRSAHICKTTVAEQRKNNIHVHDGIDQQTFVTMREQRDASLDPPRLILPSIQVNIRAGFMPPADDNGVVYLKIPVNRL